MEQTFRVRVDATAGTVEVEGPEAFVREMLDRYSSVVDRSPKPRTRKKPGRTSTKKVRPRAQTADAGDSKKGRAARVEVDEKLREQLQPHLSAFATYLDERNVAARTEEAAVVASFLASKVGQESMDERQYVTVLRTLGRPLPKIPRQVLLDAKNKKQFFYEEGTSFRLTTTGLNFAEHESLKEQSK